MDSQWSASLYFFAKMKVTDEDSIPNSQCTLSENSVDLPIVFSARILNGNPDNSLPDEIIGYLNTESVKQALFL